LNLLNQARQERIPPNEIEIPEGRPTFEDEELAAAIAASLADMN
jgi:hypothetical protein